MVHAAAAVDGGTGLPSDTFQELRGGAGGLAESMDAGAAARLPDRGLPGLWQRYLDSLDRRPLLTKAVSTGIIDGTANLIEQAISSHPFSLVTWTSFTLVGGCFIGPGLHFWFNVLDRMTNSKRLTSRVPSKWGRVLVTIALDQSFGASMMNCTYFTMHTVIMAALTGNFFPLSELGSAIYNKVTSRYVTMIINNAKVWPPASLIVFGFVPKKLRVLVVNCVAVFWGYLMSKWIK
eukprot:g14425.t1